MDGAAFRTRELSPERWFEAFWVVLFFGGLLAAFACAPTLKGTTGAEFLWWLAMLLSMLEVRELAPLAVMRAFGARPNFRLRPRDKPGTASWWVAEGHGFTGRQYAAVCSVPFLCTVAVGALYVAFTPARDPGWLLMSVYLLADWRILWVSALSLRQPPGTLLEEREEGARIYQPLERRA